MSAVHNQSRTHLVSEADGWSVFIPGLPVAADGPTLDEAVTEMVDALREYTADWRERLSDTSNHNENWSLVQLVGRSSDEQLRDWIVGLPGESVPTAGSTQGVIRP